MLLADVDPVAERAGEAAAGGVAASGWAGEGREPCSAASEWVVAGAGDLDLARWRADVPDEMDGARRDRAPDMCSESDRPRRTVAALSGVSALLAVPSGEAGAAGWAPGTCRDASGGDAGGDDDDVAAGESARTGERQPHCTHCLVPHSECTHACLHASQRHSSCLPAAGLEETAGRGQLANSAAEASSEAGSLALSARCPRACTRPAFLSGPATVSSAMIMGDGTHCSATG